MSEIPLRLRLNADFGVELDIEGGTGKKTAPIIVTSQTVEEAVATQMQVLRCIGKGRRIAWRLLSQEAADIAPKAVRTIIETVEYAGDEVVTQREAYYFVLEALPAGFSAAVPEPSGFEDPTSGLRLPYQLGWLHYDGFTDYEAKAAGMGCSGAYGGFGVKGTVYVYRADCPAEADGADVEAARREFARAVAELVDLNPGAKPEREDVIRDSAGRPRFLYSQYGLADQSVSSILLTARHGRYVKFRMTWEGSDAKIHEIAMESLRATMRAVAK